MACFTIFFFPSHALVVHPPHLLCHMLSHPRLLLTVSCPSSLVPPRQSLLVASSLPAGLCLAHVRSSRPVAYPAPSRIAICLALPLPCLPPTHHRSTRAPLVPTRPVPPTSARHLTRSRPHRQLLVVCRLSTDTHPFLPLTQPDAPPDLWPAPPPCTACPAPTHPSLVPPRLSLKA